MFTTLLSLFLDLHQPHNPHVKTKEITRIPNNCNSETPTMLPTIVLPITDKEEAGDFSTSKVPTKANTIITKGLTNRTVALGLGTTRIKANREDVQTDSDLRMLGRKCELSSSYTLDQKRKAEG